MALGRKTGDSRSSLGLTPGGIVTGDRIGAEELTRDVSIFRMPKPALAAILSARPVGEVDFWSTVKMVDSSWRGAFVSWTVSSMLEPTKLLLFSIPSCGLLLPLSLKTLENWPELNSSFKKLDISVLGLGEGSIQPSINALRLSVPAMLVVILRLQLLKQTHHFSWNTEQSC